MQKSHDDMIHVSSLGGLVAAAASLSTFDLLTLLSPGHPLQDLSALKPCRHLVLSFHDIAELQPDLVAPDVETMQAVIGFGRDAVPTQPLLIHCWAGISRSSAAAYVIACDRNPGHERAIAAELRRCAPFVTPNPLMVRLVDNLLGRGGEMTSAITAIGRGSEAVQGTTYRLPTLFPLGSVDATAAVC